MHNYDIELAGVLHDYLHDVLAIGAAVGAETADADAQTLHQLEEAAQRLGLHEAHIRVAVSILHIDNQPADSHHTWSVAVEVLVGELCIVLLSLEEHVVEVHVIGMSRNELACGDEQFQEQFVQACRRVEVVGVARHLSRVADVLRGKLADAAKHRVCTWYAGMRTLNEVVLQELTEVFHTAAATEEYTDDGTDDLAVLVAHGSASKPQVGVYLAAQQTVKFVHYEIYSTERCDFLIFLLYLCHVIGNILAANQLFSERNFLELQDKRIEQLKILSNLYQESPIKITERIESIDNMYKRKTGENDKKITKSLDNNPHFQDGEKETDNLSDESGILKKI